MNARKPSLEELEARLAQLKLKVQQHINDVDSCCRKLKMKKKAKDATCQIAK